MSEALRPPYRALLWEQWRVAGVTALSIAATALLVMGCMYASYGPGYLNRSDAADAGIWGLYALSLMAVAALCLRQDAAGHLVFSFERRLARLPIRTGTLVSIIFAARFVAMAVMLLAAAVIYRLFFAAWPSAFALLLPLSCFALVQAFLWCRQAFTGLDYLAPAALLMAPAMHAALFIGAGGGPERTASYLNSAQFCVQWLGSPIGIVCSMVVAYAASLTGVAWDRRDIRRGLPTLAELREMADGALRAKADTTSPIAAQVWYESRRMMVNMTLVWLLTLAIIGMLTAAFPSVHRELSMIAQYGPLAALVLTGPVAAIWPRSRYAMLRPHSNSAIAGARLIAFAQALTYLTLAAAVLSILGLLTAGYGVETLILADAWARGDIGLAGICALALAPCVVAFLTAWTVFGIFAAASRWVVLGVAVLIAGGIAVYSVDDDLLTLAGISLAITGVTGAITVYAFVRRAITWRTLAGCAGVAAAVWLVLYLLAPREFVVSYSLAATPPLDVSETARLALPLWTTLPGLAAGALVALPFAVVPLGVRARRSN